MSINTALLDNINQQLKQSLNPDLETARDIEDSFKFYIFNIIIKAARNEGALVYYKDVLKRNPETLVFRRRAGQIYDLTQPYTHAD
jgi:hypothetical protein